MTLGTWRSRSSKTSRWTSGTRRSSGTCPSTSGRGRHSVSSAATGSGKTTPLRALLGICQPTAHDHRALLLLGGFTVFTGVLVAIGAIMPTVKETGTIFGPLMAMMFSPFYTVTMVISDPEALMVQVLTHFPLTAPVTAMLRNGLGTLGPVEAAIVVADTFIVGALILRLAVYLFQYGSIEYSKKLSMAGTFCRSELAAK